MSYTKTNIILYINYKLIRLKLKKKKPILMRSYRQQVWGSMSGKEGL